MSVGAYQTAMAVMEDPRQSEYRVFAKITGNLMDSQSKGRKALIEAVDWNRRLWQTLQLDLVSDENELPDKLKAQLISLSIWVDKHSGKVLRGAEDVAPLIDINRTVMEGLKT